MPVIVTLEPCTKLGVAVPEPPRATGKIPVVPPSMGSPVALVNVPLAGVPRLGVTRVGLVAKTAAPLPVSSVRAAAKLADVNDPKEAALPTDVTMPVRLALVVTVPAVKPAAVPVMFVPTRVDGVPRFGVTSVGLSDSTLLPVPVEVVTPVPPLVTGSAVPKVRALKCESASITFVPLTNKCIFAPLGTVMPVPAAVFTRMLWPPDVLFWTMYCFWIVGTTRLRVAVKAPVEVALRTKARGTCGAGPKRSVKSIVRLASEVKIGLLRPVIAGF